MSPGQQPHTSAVRIIAVSLALFTLALSLVSVYYLRQLDRDTKNLIFAQQYSTVSLLADRIDRILRNQIEVLEGISRQIVEGEQLRPLEQIQTAFDQRIHLKQYFNGGLLLLDLDAVVLVDSSPYPDRPGVQFVDSPHYQRLFARNDPVIGPPLLGRIINQALLPVSVPVWSESGRPLAIITGIVNLEANNFLDRETGHLHGETGSYLVIDADSGLVVAATDKAMVLDQVPPPGENPLHDRAMGGFEGSGGTTSQGMDYLASVRGVPGTPWFVVARLPAQEALAPVRKLQKRLLGAALVILLLVGSALTWFIRRQLDPLVKHADLLDAMTAGHTPARPLPVDRHDELGRLLQSFNRLLLNVQAAEEKFRGITEASLDLIFRLDGGGLVSYCSPAAEQILGYEPTGMIGSHFRRYIAPEDLSKAQKAFTTALQGEDLRLWEITMRRRDGSTFIGEVNIGPIREDDRVIGAQGVVRDVTSRRQAAAALAQQLFFQKMVADISTTFIKSRGDLIHGAVENALAMSGGYFGVDRAYVFLFSPDQQTLSNSHEWCAPGIVSYKDRIQQVPINNYPWVIARLGNEPYVHLPDIDALPPEAAAEREEFMAQEIKSMLLVPMHGPDGQLGFMGYDAVRKPRSWSEEEITLLNVVAECISGALVRSQVETQLQLRGQELTRSNAELTDFAHIASHDLQEPLRKVIAFGDRLRLKCGSMLDDRGRDYLERMQNAAERMQRLIEDLLQYSRVTTRGGEFEPVDLNGVLQEVLEDLERPVAETAAVIKLEPLPVVQADRRQMHSLFLNLLNNALKYRCPEESPKITVEVQPWGAGGVEIMVGDNGIGFDDKYLDRIFRPFQRLHGRSEYQGSGIGLAICKKIIDRHGGEITAHGTPGAGARFIIRLPQKA